MLQVSRAMLPATLGLYPPSRTKYARLSRMTQAMSFMSPAACKLAESIGALLRKLVPPCVVVG